MLDDSKREYDLLNSGQVIMKDVIVSPVSKHFFGMSPQKNQITFFRGNYAGEDDIYRNAY